jgi:hypothetical protein
MGDRAHDERVYTIEDIASLAGLTASYIRKHYVYGGSGRPFDLSAIISLVQGARARRSKAALLEEWCTDPKIATFWANRWPRLDMYRCSHGPCGEFLLGATGYCEKHGGGKSAWRLVGRYMKIWLGAKYVPYHRVILGEAADGFDVHHVDCNSLNNRTANLAVLTPEVHMAVHGRSFSGVCQSKVRTVDSNDGLPSDVITVGVPELLENGGSDVALASPRHSPGDGDDGVVQRDPSELDDRADAVASHSAEPRQVAGPEAEHPRSTGAMPVLGGDGK